MDRIQEEKNPPIKPTETIPSSEIETPKPKAHPDPTRYGDWEINGKCVDF
jgi:hypothetical protein